jgi:trigger factor
VDASTCKKELVIEIPTDVVQREADSVAAQYARRARIPGFRPGHAPTSIVRRHFRDDIRSEVVQTLIPKFFETAVKDQKWEVVGQPRFEELKFEEDQPLTCKASFEVLPDFELKQYKELEVEEGSPVVTDADLDKAIDDLRDNAATFEVVSDRPAEDDDFITLNYQGRDSNDPGEKPVEARDAVVHLGDKQTVAAFTENLRGAKPGEAREFQATYPADYPQKSLAGKTYSYKAEVLSIKKKVVPPADDDLAKSVSECATLEELRAKLRRDLEERAQRRAEIATKQKLVDQLLQAHEFPVPEVMVDAQLDRKLEGTLTRLLAQGIDPRETDVDWRKVREDARPDAEKEVRASLILGKVAEAERVDLTEEEVDEVIRDLARERHIAPAELKTRLTRDGRIGSIKTTRRNQKALDFIYRNAKIIRKSE